MTYKLVQSPAGIPSPVNPVLVQCKLNPKSVYKNPTYSDYIAPSFSLVFTNTNFIDSNFLHNIMKRSRHDGVMNVITNTKNIEKRMLTDCRLKCVGVAYDGTMDSNSVRKHPDACGRMSIIVHGVVTIVCNTDDLAQLSCGDEISWELRDNGLLYSTCPRDWSTIKLVKYTPTVDVITETELYSSIFGSQQKFIGTEANYNELKHRLIFLSSLRKTTVEEAIQIDDISPQKLVGVIANFMFVLLGITIPPNKTWEDMLYDANSDYYIMTPRPANEDDKAWIYDCFGEMNSPMYVKFNNDEAEITNTLTPDSYFIPQSLGWFREFLMATKKEDVYKKFKTNKSFSTFVMPEVAYRYNAHGDSNVNLNVQINSQSYSRIMGTRTATHLMWIKCAKDGFLKRGVNIGTVSEPTSSFKFYRYLSKTGFDFADINQDTAKKIKTDILNGNLAPTKDYNDWIKMIKTRHISDIRQKNTNKIGTLLTKTNNTATICLGLN